MAFGAQVALLPSTFSTSTVAVASPTGLDRSDLPEFPAVATSASLQDAYASATEQAQRVVSEQQDTPTVSFHHDVPHNDTHDNAFHDRTSGKSDSSARSDEDRIIRDIPEYVYEYAPVVHLFSGEKFWPSDIQEHLRHMTPYVNYTDVSRHEPPPNVTNLASFNRYGRELFLTSKDNVEDRPGWLTSEYGIPEGPGEAGRSNAPAVLVVVKKDDGIVDAFWFFFYSYNLGNKVLNVRFGNHVGDWEHTMVRFKDGKPQALFYSEHFFGQAYTYQAVEKHGKRPITYSATGTHAMYATAGIHRYILPLGLLHDETDRGPLWDPALNAHAYTFDLAEHRLYASNKTPDAPLEWFYFVGHWGDRAYPLIDKRQYQFAGQYHYVDGPNGPRFKDLGRSGMCQGSGECQVKNWLVNNQVRQWPDDQQIGAELGFEEDVPQPETDPQRASRTDL